MLESYASMMGPKPVPMLDRFCTQCGAEYVNVGHPLRLGVVAQRQCRCVLTMQEVGPGSFVGVMAPPIQDVGAEVGVVEKQTQ